MRRFCIAKWACDTVTEDADLGKKKIIFSDKAHIDLGGYVHTYIHNWSLQPISHNTSVRIIDLVSWGYVNKQNCRIWGT